MVFDDMLSIPAQSVPIGILFIRLHTTVLYYQHLHPLTQTHLVLCPGNDVQVPSTYAGHVFDLATPVSDLAFGGPVWHLSGIHTLS